MGEDLPADVFHQWKHWCQFPNYFFGDPRMPDVAERFARVTTPIVAANALDDSWATPASRDAFMAGYSGTVWRAVDIDPARSRLGAIGHMGYFRRGSEPLWQAVLDWFDAHFQHGETGLVGHPGGVVSPGVSPGVGPQ